MKTKLFVLGLVALIGAILLGCQKEQPTTSTADIAKMSLKDLPLAQKPYARLRHIYPWRGCRDDGSICGPCAGLCVGTVFGLAIPDSSNIASGISQVKLIPNDGSKTVIFIPVDLPMDPGTGTVIVDDTVRTTPGLAAYLGYSSVKLIGGTYTVDYSHGERYGRIVLPAVLVH